MFRPPPRRSHKSQGFKVKHALQLFLLVTVSIWLLYQVRHSREKKVGFEEAAKETIKLGRKDLLPRMDDTIIREVGYKEEHKIVARSKHQEIGAVDEHENHRIGGEIDHPSYGKRQREGLREDASEGRRKKEENEQTEEGKEHQLKKETESEETQDSSGEAKEREEENEGVQHEAKGTGENEGKTDEASSAVVAHDLHNATIGDEHGQMENSDKGENKAHEFVRWSNTNSTEAYIHQEERARNMREGETDGDNGIEQETKNNNIVSSGNSTTNGESDSGKNVQNLTANGKNNSTPKVVTLTSDQLSDSRGTYPAANSTHYSGYARAKPNAYSDAVKNQDSNATSDSQVEETHYNVQSSNTNNNTDIIQEKDEPSHESTSSNDVQKLKEEVDYSSVSRKKDESSNENTGADDVQKLKEIVDYSSVSWKKGEASRVNTNKMDNNQGTEASYNDTNDSSSDTSIPQEEKDARTDLETLPGSLTNREETAAE